MTTPPPFCKTEKCWWPGEWMLPTIQSRAPSCITQRQANGPSRAACLTLVRRSPRPRTVQQLDLSESTSVSHPGLVHRGEYCGGLRWTMRLSMDPFRLLLISVAGWLKQQQQDVIDYLQEENWVLREHRTGPIRVVRFQRRPH